MRHSAIRLLMIGACAMTAVAAAATDVDASSRHIRKHHQRTNLGGNDTLRRSWAAQPVRLAAPSWSRGGDVCPGATRSFDCKIWPPPFDDDPDRKGTDGGP
jgi:hypothetical protein